jgi:predicted metal-dependent phosphotriesterase family hydrolase
MSEGTVETVLGPVDPASLGVTDAHDHLFLRTPALPGQEFDDLDAMCTEVRGARESGVGAIVEMTPIGCGRRPERLRQLSTATAVHVVAATGFHRDAHYPEGHWVHQQTAEQLARLIVADLNEGMHPADWEGDATPDPARAGVIKAGASYHRITRDEEPRLIAAALGSGETGAPILVHTEVGTAANEIIDLLERHGARPDRLVLAHLDRNPDPELHLDIAARGVTLGYDTPGRIKYGPDSRLLELIETLVAAGHLERLLLGLDLGRREYFRVFGGGPGLRYLMDVFVPRLRGRIGEAAVQQILVANPARAFTLRPAKETVA